LQAKNCGIEQDSVADKIVSGGGLIGRMLLMMFAIGSWRECSSIFDG
jgi:hypothetical protein